MRPDVRCGPDRTCRALSSPPPYPRGVPPARERHRVDAVNWGARSRGCRSGVKDDRDDQAVTEKPWRGAAVVGGTLGVARTAAHPDITVNAQEQVDEGFCLTGRNAGPALADQDFSSRSCFPPGWTAFKALRTAWER